MADFKDKFSGKAFNTQPSLSASLAASGDSKIDGRKHEFLHENEALGLLPFRVKEGDQSKFFPGLKEGTSAAGILTGSIVRDVERQIVYIPLTLKSLKENIIGVGSFVSTSFTNTASYQAVSQSFVNQFSGTNEGLIIQYLVQENYTASGAGEVELLALSQHQLILKLLMVLPHHFRAYTQLEFLMGPVMLISHKQAKMQEQKF